MVAILSISFLCRCSDSTSSLPPPDSSTPSGEVEESKNSSVAPDLNGVWRGLGKFIPNEVYAITYSDPQASREEVPCEISVDIKLTESQIFVNWIRINAPSISWHHPYSISDFKDLLFEYMHYDLRKDNESDDLIFSQIHRPGAYENEMKSYGSLSKTNKELRLFAVGGYLGAYKSGTGSTTTGARFLVMNWDQNGNVTGNVVFSSGMGRVYTEGLCKNAVLTKLQD